MRLLRLRRVVANVRANEGLETSINDCSAMRFLHFRKTRGGVGVDSGFSVSTDDWNALWKALRTPSAAGALPFFEVVWRTYGKRFGERFERAFKALSRALGERSETRLENVWGAFEKRLERTLESA